MVNDSMKTGPASISGKQLKKLTSVFHKVEMIVQGKDSQDKPKGNAINDEEAPDN